MMNNLLNAIVFVALIATFLFASDLGPSSLSVVSGTASEPAAISATTAASNDLIWTPRLSD